MTNNINMSYRKRLYCFFIALPAASAALSRKNCAYKGGTVDYLSEINCPVDFEVLQSVPLKSNYAAVKSIKTMYDLCRDII